MLLPSLSLIIIFGLSQLKHKIQLVMKFTAKHWAMGQQFMLSSFASSVSPNPFQATPDPKILDQTGCQHTPRAYPTNPQTPKWKESLHKLLVGGLGYVPGVCWKILRKMFEIFPYSNPSTSTQESLPYMTCDKELSSDYSSHSTKFHGGINVIKSLLQRATFIIAQNEDWPWKEHATCTENRTFKNT